MLVYLKIDAYCSIGHKPEEVEREIWNEIEKIHRELITEKELQKVKNQTESQTLSNYQTVLSKADQLAHYYVIHGNTDEINHELDKILSITREEIRDSAVKYLRPENSVVLYYLPKEQKTSK
jgi:zinc protease